MFFESPALVGFSSDKDHKFHYTDNQTADDAFSALKNFLFHAAPEFENRKLYLSGESYAGKYVPDIADRIASHNEDPNESAPVLLPQTPRVRFKFKIQL